MHSKATLGNPFHGHGVPSHRHIAREPQFGLPNAHEWMCMPTCSLALLYLSAPLDWPTHPTPSPPACTPRLPLPCPWCTVTPPYRTRTAIRTSERTRMDVHAHTCSFALLYLSALLDWPTHPTPSPSACTPRPPLHGHGTPSHRHIPHEP